MNMDPLALLELARKSGAESAEVYQTGGISRSVSFEANRLKQIETGDELGTALRIWRHSRPGLAVAEGPVDPAALVEKAIALSAFGEPEEPQLAGQSPEFDRPVVREYALEQLIAWGEEALGAVREHYPQVICSGGYSASIDELRLVNSTGLDLSYASSSLDGYIGAEWVRGDDFLQVFEGEAVSDLPNPAGIAARVLRKLAWATRSATVATGLLPVLFTTKAVGVLLGAVSAALDGRQVRQQSSPWSGKLGEPVLSSLLSFSQDPGRSPYDTPFDDEGTPTVALDFCRDGVLKTFYADRRTARALGLGLTGNGFRNDLGSYPQPGLFNLIVAPGSCSLDGLIASMKEGIIVDQVLGSGANLSGEFSVNIDLGYRVRRGEVIGRLKDTMVAGNAYAALQRLGALSDEQSWEDSLLTPSLLIESLAVTGRG